MTDRPAKMHVLRLTDVEAQAIYDAVGKRLAYHKKMADSARARNMSEHIVRRHDLMCIKLRHAFTKLGKLS